jgi:asparagine synthase (glutamine-hydrolysing)
MQHSLESRLPFMDYRLVELVFQLPSEYKIRDGYGKYIQTSPNPSKGGENYAGLPSFGGVGGGRVKIGFHSPTATLFQSEEANSPTAILLSERCLNRGLFDKKTMEKMISELRKGRGVYGAQLYRLLGVELWFREFMD